MAGHDKQISKIITNLVLVGLISIISGKFIFKWTEDLKWVGFNYYFFAGIFILITLLILNNYLWFTITSLILILGAACFILYKVNLENVIESANNIDSNNNSIMGSMKANPKNFSFFFWMMFLITCVTAIGVVIARKSYYKMKLKESPIGDIGSTGERGDIGGKSTIINSPNEIAYQHLLKHANNVIEKIKIDRNIDFEPGIEHLKNFDFKGHIKRIAYSKNFMNEIFKLARCKHSCSRENYLKDYYCQDKQKFMVVILNKMKDDLTQWIERIALYKKGLLFLESSLLMPRDWETLYLNKDKEAGLKPNPYDHFKDLSTEWGCLNKSNFTDCSKCVETVADPILNTNTDSNNKKEKKISLVCNGNKRRLNKRHKRDKRDSIVNHAFKPIERSNQEIPDGNYTWNWGAV